MVARRLVIRGRVQGVGYRFAMVAAAEATGVAGWVRNRRDGTVEALVQGDAVAVERIVEWCRHGPSGARVIEVSTLVVVPLPSIDAFTARTTE